MPNIYIIHPIDENLRFLKKAINDLADSFPSIATHIPLSNNNQSHDDCLSIIQKTAGQDLLCFFCHGRTDGLLGCRYRAEYPSHRRKYEHGLMINSENIHVLRDKKVFCLACNSNEVGEMAIGAGVKVFLGFDDIAINTNPNIHVKANVKYAIRKLIVNVLKLGIKNNFMFYQLSDYLKLFINKENDSLIFMNKKRRGFSKYYLQTANILQQVKEGIRVWGDGTIRING